MSNHQEKNMPRNSTKKTLKNRGIDTRRSVTIPVKSIIKKWNNDGTALKRSDKQCYAMATPREQRLHEIILVPKSTEPHPAY